MATQDDRAAILNKMRSDMEATRNRLKAVRESTSTAPPTLTTQVSAAPSSTATGKSNVVASKTQDFLAVSSQLQQLRDSKAVRSGPVLVQEPLLLEKNERLSSLESLQKAVEARRLERELKSKTELTPARPKQIESKIPTEVKQNFRFQLESFIDSLKNFEDNYFSSSVQVPMPTALPLLEEKKEMSLEAEAERLALMDIPPPSSDEEDDDGGDTEEEEEYSYEEVSEDEEEEEVKKAAEPQGKEDRKVQVQVQTRTKQEETVRGLVEREEDDDDSYDETENESSEEGWEGELLQDTPRSDLPKSVTPRGGPGSSSSPRNKDQSKPALVSPRRKPVASGTVLLPSSELAPSASVVGPLKTVKPQTTIGTTKEDPTNTPSPSSVNMASASTSATTTSTSASTSGCKPTGLPPLMVSSDNSTAAPLLPTFYKASPSRSSSSRQVSDGSTTAEQTPDQKETKSRKEHASSVSCYPTSINSPTTPTAASSTGSVTGSGTGAGANRSKSSFIATQRGNNTQPNQKVPPPLEVQTGTSTSLSILGAPVSERRAKITSPRNGGNPQVIVSSRNLDTGSTNLLRDTEAAESVSKLVIRRTVSEAPKTTSLESSSEAVATVAVRGPKEAETALNRPSVQCVTQGSPVRAPQSPGSEPIKPARKPKMPSTPSTNNAESPSQHPEPVTVQVPDGAALDQQANKRASVISNPSEQKQRMRVHVFDELVRTEHDYVQDLLLTSKMFYMPLKTQNLLDAKQIVVLFSNLNMLLGVSHELLKDLGKENAIDNVGSSFCFMMDFLKLYAVYCTNHPQAVLLLDSLRKSNSKFDSFLKDQQENLLCRGLPLNGFLIKPVQRVTKYPLLLKQLRNYTESFHPDFENIEQAITRCETILSDINAYQTAMENHHRLVQIKENLPNADGIIDMSLHNFLQEDLVREAVIPSQGEEENNIETKRMFYILLNTMLIRTIPKKRNLNVYSTTLSARTLTKKHIYDKLRIVQVVPLSNLIGLKNVEDNESNNTKNAFQLIYTKPKEQVEVKLLVMSSSPIQKSEWILKLSALTNPKNRSQMGNRSISQPDASGSLVKSIW
eukprot:TRINITY_DN7811_c0_g1_i1.p1 TRINITY_DN7811_c0_g1~~TRINITY_DN7811_c0_g1_i1.p1  ORF type:complete len:1075 (+),score=239.15 TRINITY_DN7811_c0_g1_i1:45-3269(+)